MNTIWEEKNYTEPEKNCLSNNGNAPSGSMNEIRSDLTTNEWKDIGETRKRRTKNQQESDRRWYLKNKDRIKTEIAQNIKNKSFTKNCSVCGKLQIYPLKHVLESAVKNKTECPKCAHRRPEYIEKLKKPKRVKYNRKRPYESLYNTLLRNAAARNIECDITYEEFLEFTTILTCTYCETHINWEEYGKMAQRGAKRNVATNLDRKDSSIGYKKPNCCVCCPMCNSIKNKFFAYDEMLKIGKFVRNIVDARKTLTE